MITVMFQGPITSKVPLAESEKRKGTGTTRPRGRLPTTSVTSGPQNTSGTCGQYWLTLFFSKHLDLPPLPCVFSLQRAFLKKSQALPSPTPFDASVLSLPGEFSEH